MSVESGVALDTENCCDIISDGETLQQKTIHSFRSSGLDSLY